MTVDAASIYTGPVLFTYLITVILAYVGLGLLSTWYFAYQYLLTSRTLTAEVRRRKLEVEEEEGYIDADVIEQDEESNN